MMPLKVMVAPLRYVQGPDALSKLGEQLAIIGLGNPLVVTSPSAKRAVGDKIEAGLSAHQIPYEFADFGGECTRREISRLRDLCLEGAHDCIINCGGGKVIDAGRAAACSSAFCVEEQAVIPGLGAGVACINVPTVAATDASTSAVSLVYDDNHVAEATMAFPSNPVMVFVDTSVIAQSPVRLLVAGMGDALATHFEADMCYRTGTPAVVTQSHTTRTARALAKLCCDLLLEYGVQAIAEAREGVPGPALEAITEANVLLSGLGFESGGICGAHAVGMNFTRLLEVMAQPQYHGEMVAFGTLTQLVMEDKPREELDRIFGFCRSVGLPTTLAELSLPDVTDEQLETVALAASRDFLIKGMPRSTSEPDELGRHYDHHEILAAIKATDAYGRRFAAESA
jgi:glycerol dehydrogenase